VFCSSIDKECLSIDCYVKHNGGLRERVFDDVVHHLRAIWGIEQAAKRDKDPLRVKVKKERRQESSP
jgi:hypothetical protein